MSVRHIREYENQEGETRPLAAESADSRAFIGSPPPIRFHSSFISYSAKDAPFADRLYTDLRSHGVRCWFAPEDLKIGDKFRHKINEAIWFYERLILTLSEHSINSNWVADEVEATLERERRENRIVLFPIRLDDAVMETSIGWAANIRQTRHIGDFRGWKNHRRYHAAFARLLRDLNSAKSITNTKG
jgi:TIR domain